MINERLYQEIFDELSKYLVQGWDKLVIYLEYGAGSYSIAFYVKADQGYVKCYDLPGVSDEDLLTSFSAIDKLVSRELSKVKDELWSNMTITITSDGKMHADMDYTDLSGGTYRFKKDWKKKYLN